MCPRLARTWSIGVAAARCFEVYERPIARDVRFEESDLPEVKTEDGISATGDLREAWFRDPDDNILRIHSHAET